MRAFRKALVAAGVAFAGGLGVALTSGSVSWAEVLAALGAGLVTGAGTYRVKNAGT